MSTVTTVNRAKIATCRARIQSAVKAAKQVESDIRWLVKERAWEVLGYENFSAMWAAECGFAAPPFIRIVAANAMMDEGMNSNHPKIAPNGHLQKDIAKAIGFKTSITNKGSEGSSTVSALDNQRRDGIPLREQRMNYRTAHTTMRARATPRRTGKGPQELVHESVNVVRADADAIDKIARESHVPKAEIYRQAISEYLMRHRESRTRKSSR